MVTKTLANITESLRLSTGHEQYEVVTQGVINDCEEKNLIISGAFLYKNTFKNVTFENCTFFGSKLQECLFIGCTFNACKFQFSNILECNFRSCEFQKCLWDVSFIQRNKFSYCSIDHLTAYHIGKNENDLENCFSEKSPDWDSFLKEFPA